MKNKFILFYGICAFLLIFASIFWFALSLRNAIQDGTAEADRSFSWLARETAASSLENGFLSESFIEDLTSLCAKSRLLSAVMIETPAGVVYLWPENSSHFAIGTDGNPKVVTNEVFRKVYGTALDIGDSAAGSIRMTAIIAILQPGVVFSASRNSFMLVLAVMLVTFIVIIVYQPGTPGSSPSFGRNIPSKTDTADMFFHPVNPAVETSSRPSAPVDSHETREMEHEGTGENPDPYFSGNDDEESAQNPVNARDEADHSAITRPEGLFSPVTGIGWEQYLEERLDAELVRAASSEQDLALMIVRVSGLRHTDLLARNISSILLEAISFRDMLFEFGTDGFAGILQNVNLDMAMKTAEKLFARIDETLIELSSDSGIALGVTTRTARLLPAARMIQEATAAAKKAQDEPNLPIVAFRANPEKYRAYVAESVPGS